MTPDPWFTASFASVVAAWLVLVGLVVHAAWSARSTLARHLPWLAIGWAVVLAVMVAWVPLGPWASNHHDSLRIAHAIAGDWVDPKGLSRVHGHAPYVLFRALGVATQHAWSQPAMNRAAWLGSLGVLGLLAARASGRPLVGAATMLLVGLHPAVLRVASSGSPFPLFVGLVALALVAADRVRSHGRVRDVAVTAAALVLAAQTRGEGIVEAPVAVVLWMLGRGVGRWPTALRSPAGAGVVAIAGLALLPRCVVLWQRMTEVGLPTVVEASGEVSQLDGARPAALLYLAWGMALWIVITALGAVLAEEQAAWAARWPWLPAAAAWVGFAALVAVLPHGGAFDDGRFTPLPPNVAPYAWFHAPFHPGLTHPAWLALALVGLTVTCLRRPREGLMLVGLAGLSMVIHVAEHDGISTFARVSLPSVAVLGAAAAVGATAFGSWRAAPLGAAVVAGVAALTVLPQEGFLRHVWPMQQEHALLDVARAAPDDVTLVALDAYDDTAWEGGRWWVWYRLLTTQALQQSGRRVVGVDALLDGEVTGEAWFISGLDCLRALFPERLTRDREVWRVGDVVLRYDGAWLLQTGNVHLDAQQFAPCWDDPSARTCDEEGPDGCAVWRCTGGSSPPYLDPACRAVRDTFELQPIVETRVHRGNLSDTKTALLDPDGVIGVYRVGRRREAPPPSAP